MPIAHEGHFLGWCACQMASYVKDSSCNAAPIPSGHFAVTGWTLTSVIPLGEQPAVSLTVPGQLNHCEADSMALCPWVCVHAHLQRPSCPHFIMCWLGVDYSVRWVWLFNPERCFRKTGFLATWPQNSTIWTIWLSELFVFFFFFF